MGQEKSAAYVSLVPNRFQKGSQMARSKIDCKACDFCEETRGNMALCRALADYKNEPVWVVGVKTGVPRAFQDCAYNVWTTLTPPETLVAMAQSARIGAQDYYDPRFHFDEQVA